MQLRPNSESVVAPLLRKDLIDRTGGGIVDGRSSPELAALVTQSKDSKARLASLSTVVLISNPKTEEEEYIRFWCPEATAGNSHSRTGTFFEGLPGLVIHMRHDHGRNDVVPKDMLKFMNQYPDIDIKMDKKEYWDRRKGRNLDRYEASKYPAVTPFSVVVLADVGV